MEKMELGDTKKLTEELLQGLEMARQLQIHLHVASTPHETRDLLIQNIISAFENALHILKWTPPPSAAADPSPSPSPSPLVGIRMPHESPSLNTGSPHSEESDRDLRDQDPNASRKRKSLPRWTKQIRVSPGMGVEGPLDDGYSWRKYGQKDILGATYPRGYYRCTHRNVQGCMATKQVQRSDEDPNVFEITYRGSHTCTLASSSSNTNNASLLASTTTPNNTNNNNNNVLQSLDHHHHQQQQPPPAMMNELLLNLRAGLRVQTENLDFNFPNSNHVFSSQPQPMLADNNFPSYMSPATSGISQFSMSSTPNNFATSSGNHINEMISSATAAATTSASNSNSPTVGLDFPFDQFELDAQNNFMFDNPRFFP
ncbi:WRKY Transcription Factor [Stylosanthes scabra]|uniref:WRKY Transcription Factor n=1 Tax=Stylosanthes scabra TaxID=79078 RepID=A0ABU6Z1X7_9FABA|nr:WRKY Transcription Factor [Stylosanthes scabra]